MEIFCEDHGHPQIQLRGLRYSSRIQTGKKSWNDRTLSAKHDFVRDLSAGIEPSQQAVMMVEAKSMTQTVDRAAYCYLRKLRSEISKDEIFSMYRQYQHLTTWVAEHSVPEVETGTSELAQQEWGNDSEDTVKEWENTLTVLISRLF